MGDQPNPWGWRPNPQYPSQFPSFWFHANDDVNGSASNHQASDFYGNYYASKSGGQSNNSPVGQSFGNTEPNIDDAGTSCTSETGASSSNQNLFVALPPSDSDDKGRKRRRYFKEEKRKQRLKHPPVDNLMEATMKDPRIWDSTKSSTPDLRVKLMKIYGESDYGGTENEDVGGQSTHKQRPKSSFKDINKSDHEFLKKIAAATGSELNLPTKYVEDEEDKDVEDESEWGKDEQTDDQLAEEDVKYQKYLWRTLRQRKWCYTDVGRSFRNSHKQSSKDGTFRVVTYNVLAQKLLTDHMSLYEATERRYLKWDHRSKNLVEELVDTNADVICLQEVQENHYSDFFQPELETYGYLGVYMVRTGDKCDGCATFYKKQKLNLLKHKKIMYQKNDWILDRDNVALLLKLQLKANSHDKKHSDKGKNRPFIVANTHLLFNPKRGDVKLGQLMVLFAELDEFAYREQEKGNQKSQYDEIILCGDLNTLPFSPLYKFIVSGQLNYVDLNTSKMSGQPQDRPSSRVNKMNKRSLPNVGITDNCQYQRVLEKRYEQSSGSKSKELEQGESSKLPTSHNTSSTAVNKESKKSMVRCSGRVTHGFSFKSVYNHALNGDYFNEGNRQVTTVHAKAAATVDYIFYSPACDVPDPNPNSKPKTKLNHKREQQEEKKTPSLQCHGSLDLPLKRKLSALPGFPNRVVSSDHLLLAALFAKSDH